MWGHATRCTGKIKPNIPGAQCGNKTWSANKLEGMVWDELKGYLKNPALIYGELERQSQDANQQSVFEAELERVERQLKAADREQRQLLQWALKGFPKSQIEAENERINKSKDTLKNQKAELEARVKASRNAVINIPKLETYIHELQDKISNLDFEGKRLVLDMLGTTIWLDGENVEVTGIIDLENNGVTLPTNIPMFVLW